MQAQQHVRITTGPVTAAFVLIATLALGAFGGYAIATAVRPPVAIPLARQLVPQSPATLRVPASRLATEQSSVCTVDFNCLESLHSTATRFTQQVPEAKPTFDEGRTCTRDLKTCFEPGNLDIGPLTRQHPASPPTFAEGRMCTYDFKICREPQNSYD
jgi:hypothetical protein